MRILFALFAVGSAVALGDVERSLGKSPDGRFELFLTAESKADYGNVEVRELKSGARISIDSGQGYGLFPTDDIHAIWKASSDAFAVTMQGTKTTQDTDVYFRDGAAWEKLEFPGYEMNILGRQGVFSPGKNRADSFQGFEGSARFTLNCIIEPDSQQKEATAKDKGWNPSDQTEWKVVLEYHPRTKPNCSIVSITPIKTDR